jgi:choline dehydrogenase-like flavoprotein
VQQNQYSNILKQWEKVQEARNMLGTEPDNDEANETNGRYLCLVRQDWDQGLPVLVKAKDIDLAAVARLDVKNDETPQSQFATASAWWDLAEARNELEKQQMTARLAYWYEKALPGLSSLDKAEAEQGTPHHAGGSLRMSRDHSGVVDDNLKLEHYDNLFVCDVSVFPIIPAANPSLALALRLAEHLNQLP